MKAEQRIGTGDSAAGEADPAKSNLRAGAVKGRLSGQPIVTERAVAQGVAQLGGSVTLVVEGKEPTEIRAPQTLPEEPFQVLRIDLQGKSQFSDLEAEFLKAVPSLENLDVAGCSITDAALLTIGKLEKLQVLTLARTGVSDQGLQLLKGCSSLFHLRLNNTRLTDQGLSTLRVLPKIVGLEISGTQVSDVGLLHLKSLPKLEALWAADTPIAGSGLVALKDLPLKDLGLSRTRIDDRAIDAILTLESLQVLELDGCQITAEGLRRLGALKNLKRLSIKENPAAGQAAEELRKELPSCALSI